MNINRLRDFRKSLNLTQKQISKVLGVHHHTYSGWETGDNVIPLKHLNKLSNTYDVSMDYLAGLSFNKNIKFNHIELNRVNIGKRLRSARENVGLSQGDVAKELGTTQSTIWAYEIGKTLILTSFIIEFAELTNTSIDWLCCKID